GGLGHDEVILTTPLAIGGPFVAQGSDIVLVEGLGFGVGRNGGVEVTCAVGKAALRIDRFRLLPAFDRRIGGHFKGCTSGIVLARFHSGLALDGEGITIVTGLVGGGNRSGVVPFFEGYFGTARLGTNLSEFFFSFVEFTFSEKDIARKFLY